MKYKVMIGDQPYRVAMSDGEFYRVEYDKDVIVYTVDMENQVINARIENPSQHTLYLINEGKCFMTVNIRTFNGRSPYRFGCAGEWDEDDPQRKDPSWHYKEHSSGLGRGAYRFHKHWAICQADNRSDMLSEPVQVTDINNIQLSFNYRQAWSGRYYSQKNTRGYARLEAISDSYRDPYRDSFFFDIRLALLSSSNANRYSNTRVYQTDSKITRIQFDR